jgi:plasmid stabilization system protein ParE
VARYEIEVLPWAIDDTRETYLYLLERDERLADEFQRRVTEALRALAETAHHYQAREDAIRRCPLKKFPHGIMYELQGDRVIVYAVAHPKRQPGFWKKR